ncbi:MAG: hypothetical protein H6810_04190 [Phycisphaeraceae bacterium]|nr:MAG: hypothetical protein H6810_04190 [Phycisphaeraceae bacterium]
MKVRALAVLAGVAAMATAASAGFWTTGAQTGLLEGISNNGVGSGSYNPFDTNGGYFTWTVADGYRAIGGVSPGNGVGGQGKISNDGRYICGTTYNAAMGYHEMSRYDRQTGLWTGFGMIPGVGAQVDAEVSSGWAVSGDGHTVGGLGWTSLGTADTHAFLYRDGVGPIDWGTASTGHSARINGLNGDGTVAAGWQDGAGRQGAVWVNGTQELIYKTDGVTAASEAYEVSNDGRWAVGLGLGSFFSAGMAYRYDIENDVYYDISNLATGAQRSMAAAAINGDGTLIGGGTWGVGPATWGNGFIWAEGVGTMTVGEYLDMQGVNYDETFHFAFVSSISEDGQWIAGWGNYAGPADTQSFIIHIPTPGAASMLALGGLVATRRRR